MPRQLTSIEYEASRAMLSLAGLRLISQSRVVGAAAGSDNTYTVTDPRTRRVVLYVDHASNVIRFNVNAAATSTSLPIKNQTYFVVDAKKDDVLHFYDTTGSTPVHFVEVD